MMPPKSISRRNEKGLQTTSITAMTAIKVLTSHVAAKFSTEEKVPLEQQRMIAQLAATIKECAEDDQVRRKWFASLPPYDREATSKLVRAVTAGDTELALESLLARAYPNARDSSGTAVLWLAYYGRKPEHAKIFTWLARDFGANVDVRKETRMLMDSSTGDIVRAGVGDTLLLDALRSRRKDIVWLLVGKSDLSIGQETSPLLAAIRYFHNDEDLESLVSVMLECGAPTRHLVGVGVRVVADGLDIEIEGLGLCPLMEAAKHGCERVADMLLDNGAFVDSRTITHRTALMEAADHGHTRIVKKLLEKGATSYLFDIDNRTALWGAARYGHTDIVEMLMNRAEGERAFFDMPSKVLKRTPLMVASEFGHVGVVEKLLQKKESVGIDMVDGSGYTALMFASKQGHALVVRKLLQSQADMTIIETQTNHTALMMASWAGHAETVKTLLQHAKTGRAKTLKTPIDYHSLILAIKGGHAPVVQIMADHGLENFHLRWRGIPALALAADIGHKAIVSILLRNGVDVHEKREETGLTALMHAAGNGHVEVMEILLQYGAAVNQLSTSGKTALIYAAGRGHAASVEKLLEHGADANVLWTPGGDKALYDQGDMTALMIAAEKGYVAVVQKLIEKGVDVNKGSLLGRTALMTAAQEGYVEIVEKLLEAGADPFLEWTLAETSLTAFLMAAEMNHIPVVDKLLEYVDDPAELKLLDALIDAAMEGYTTVVEKVVEAGVDVDGIRSADEPTALMLAARYGHLEVVKVLLNAGADPEKKSAEGFTALMEAAEETHWAVVETLRRFTRFKK